MFYHLIENSVVLPKFTLEPNYLKLTPKKVERKGVMSVKHVFEKFDFRSIGNFNVNDFKISNILATGSYDVLKPVVAADVNPLTVIDQVDKVLKSNLPKPKQNETTQK